VRSRAQRELDDLTDVEKDTIHDEGAETNSRGVAAVKPRR